jgi:hypothetical protein
MRNKLLAILAMGALSVTSANAGWVYEDNGKLVQDCCHKAKPVKVVKKAPAVCLTCDYSKFQMAKLEPIGAEKLAPATLKNCGMK